MIAAFLTCAMAALMAFMAANKVQGAIPYLAASAIMLTAIFAGCCRRFDRF